MKADFPESYKTFWKVYSLPSQVCAHHAKYEKNKINDFQSGFSLNAVTSNENTLGWAIPTIVHHKVLDLLD